MSWGIDMGGLDLDQPMSLEPGEWLGFAAAHGAPLGFPDGLPMLRWWSKYRPDLVKTHRMSMRHDGPHVPGKATLPFITADMHTYLLSQWQFGVEYEFVIARKLGVSREEVLDTIAVASIDTVSRGLDNICTPDLEAMLDDWPQREDDQPPYFPVHWPTDRSALVSGIDLTEPGLADWEKKQLETWYRDVVGELPAWFVPMVALAPGLVKTHRIRMERALQVSPPASLPFYRLHFAVQVGSGKSIRENALLGRALGMSDADLREAILHALLISGGPTNGAIVFESIGDLIPAWASINAMTTT